jgi:cobalt-zinc-cadmium efflux system outer membrane protein
MKALKPIFFLVILALSFSFINAEKTQYSLDELISLGLENNPRIHAGLEDIQAKKAAYQASRRFLNPNFGYERGQAESFDDTVVRHTEGFSLSQPIENPFSRRFRIAIQKSRWDISVFKHQAQQREVIYEIKKLFYTILLLKSNMATAKKNEESIQETYRLIKKRVQAGEVKELEAIKLQVETLRAQNQTNRLQTELALAKENLNKFLGNTLPSGYATTGDLSYRSILVDERRIISQSLSSHPEIKTKQTELEQIEDHLHLAKWKWIPGLELSAFSRKELDGINRGFGISLDIPLWDQKTKQVKEAEHMISRTRSELSSLEVELETRIKEDLMQFLLAEKTLSLFHQGLLQQADESMRISRLSYSQGEISLIDYLDSMRTLYSIHLDYQESLFHWNLSKAALEKNLGEALK